MKVRGSIKANLVASWMTHAVALLIGVYLMPFVLRTLGDNLYGTWILINAFAGYLGLLYLGFGETICRYVATHHARRDWDGLNRVVNVILAVYLSVGSLALLIAGVLAWLAPGLHNWDGIPVTQIRLVILLLGVNFFCGMVGSVFGGVLMGIQRFDIERGIGMISGIIRLILTVVFLDSEWGLLTLSLIFLAVTLAEVAGQAFFAFVKVPTLSIGLRHFRLSTLRECFSFSAFAFLDLVSFQVMNLTDTIIIGMICGAKATVPYYIALRLCQFIGKPIRYIGRVFMPRAGELHANKERARLQNLVNKGVGLSLLLTMGFFIGAAFFGQGLIETWVGPGYGQSHLLLILLLGTQIVSTPVEVLRSVLFGMGHVRFPALVYLAEAVANVVLSLLLIGPLGLLGVALGTAIPVLVFELCVLVPYAARELQFDFGSLVRNAIAPQLIPLAGLLGYSFVVAAAVPSSTGWTLLVAIGLGGGGVLAIGWLGYDRWARHSKFWKRVAAEPNLH